MCTPCSECVVDVYVDVKINTCVIYTPAHALVPRTTVSKSLEKKCTHIYIYTHMHTPKYAHEHTCTSMTPPNTPKLLRLTIYAQICVHIHVYMPRYIHAYVYIYIYTSIYIQICMSIHIHTYAYMHTHIQHVHLHARKHAWNDGAAATAREAWLHVIKLRTSPPRENSNLEGDHFAWPAAQLTRSRGTTGKYRTITTNSSSSHHHDSAPPRQQSLILVRWYGYNPLGAWPLMPQATETILEIGFTFLQFFGIRCRMWLLHWD